MDSIIKNIKKDPICNSEQTYNARHGCGQHAEGKAFYADSLGLKIMEDYRQNDDHWWVSLAFPEGGASITLTTFHENVKPGTMALWLATSDVVSAHSALSDKGVKVNEVKDDLYGPGSGVKWFNFGDPDGNLIHLVQA